MSGTCNNAEDVNNPTLRLLKLQREARAQLTTAYIENVNNCAVDINVGNVVRLNNQSAIHPPVTHGPGNYLSELACYRNYYRVRRINRRDVKLWEKEERRRRFEIEDRKKRKNNDFLKVLMTHRDDFFRYFKIKRSGSNV